MMNQTRTADLRGQRDTWRVRGYWLLFALALLVGVAVRVYRFPQWPLGLNQDGAMTAVDGYALAGYGADRFGTSFPAMLWGWGYGQQSALYAYLIACLVPFFGFTKLAIRLPVLLMSVAALPVIWDAARRVAGKQYALIVLGLTAICPWQIMQSRWALEANLFSHMLLFSAYFLLLGIEKKPFLYVSMVFFALTMYTYGVAAYSVPVLLLLSGIMLVGHGKIKLRTLLGCAALYLLLAAPLYITLAINALGLETITWGPITMQRFDQSARSSEIALLTENPFESMGSNLTFFLRSALLQGMDDATFNALPDYRTLYLFSLPLIWAGAYLFWRKRRTMLVVGSETPQVLSMGVILWWFAAMLVCAALTNSPNISRSNGVYYVLLFFAGYGLYRLARRVRVPALLLAVCYACSFAGFCRAYFSDETTRLMHACYRPGLYEAAQFVKDMPYEYDSVSITIEQEDYTATEMIVLCGFAVDAQTFRGEKEILRANGDSMGTYQDVFWYESFDGYEPNMYYCTAYIVTQAEKAVFPQDEYLIFDFEDYAVAYPRYWAEE